MNRADDKAAATGKPAHELPFFADLKNESGKTRRCYWNVRPTNDRGYANDIGKEYAEAFLQYLKNEPDDETGVLARIAEDMALVEKDSATHGYALGFWAAIEPVLRAAPVGDAVVLSELRAEVLVEAACHIQEQMRAIRVLADGEEDADALRALMRTQSVLAQDLARNISYALGNPAKFDWGDLHMRVYGKLAEYKELDQ